jgi:hypothetical protein
VAVAAVIVVSAPGAAQEPAGPGLAVPPDQDPQPAQVNQPGEVAPLPADQAIEPGAPGQPARPSESAQAAEARRQQTQVMYMESVLNQAVRNGASALVTSFRSAPQVARLADVVMSGEPAVRGFQLQDYGVFFDVRVPGIRPTFALAYPDLLAAGLQARLAEARAVRAQSVAAAPAAPPPVAPVDAGVLSDPEAEYTRQVKTAIMDAMIENSAGLRLASGDRLTVAARDDTPVNPLVPMDQTEARTMYLTIKGADLAAYRERRITLEQARQLIVITEH